MKFTVERDAFHDALGAAIRHTKGGPDIPILSHLLVRAEGHTVTLVGHNLDSCGIIRIAADVAAQGETTVPADRLHKLVGGMPKGAAVVVDTTEQAATVRCGRASYKFSTLPASDFPGIMEVQGDPEAIELTGEQVGRLFDVPAPAIEQQQTRVYLAGICVHPMRDGIAACATNGHMLIKTTVKTARPDFPRVIVPEFAAREIVAMAKTVGAKVRITQSLISAECGERVFIGKLIDGTFPEYERVIPQPTGKPIKVDAKDFDAALDRLMTARDPKKTATVKLSWSNGELVASLWSEFGHGDEPLEVDCDRDAGETGAQVEYLRALGAAAGGEVIELDIADPGSPIRITNPKQDDFVSVCMPCRY